MRSWRLAAAAGFVLLAAIACGPDASPTATPFVTPTIPATVPPTSVLTITPAPTATSATPTVTATASPFPTPSSTPASPPVLPELQFVENADCADVSRDPLPVADVTVSDSVATVSLVAEIASTPTQQSQGLMCRAVVPGGAGMLFLWDFDRAGGFWMFNTYVPLEIIYFSGESGDISITQMSPCPRDGIEERADWVTRCSQESAAYFPGISYRAALELPQGWLETNGVNAANAAEIVVSFTERP